MQFRSRIITASAAIAAPLMLASPPLLAADWAGPGTAGRAPHVVSVRADAQHAIVEIEVPGVWVDERKHAGSSFAGLTLPNGAAHGRVGEPSLPETGLLVALPDGRAVSATVLSVETETLGSVPPAPVQPEPCRCGPRLPSRFVVDPGAYKGSVVLPDAPVVELDRAGFLRDVRVARLSLRPVAWNPASGTVELRKRITVRLSYDTPDPSAAPRRGSLGLPESFGAAASRIAVDLRQGSRPIPGPDHMVVIGPQAWLDNAQPLVDWRVSTGTRVTTQSIEGIGTKASELLGWLQQAYDTWQAPPTIVLLVGDESAVPPGYGTTANATSDFVFSKLSGSDIYADVIVGRFPARTEADVDTLVAKTVGYEATPSTGSAAAWYRGAMAISSSEGSGASNDDVRSDQVHDLLQGWGYDPIPKYYASDNTAKPAKINQSLDTGTSWISYMGHGDETSWASTEPAYVAGAEIPKLTNGNMLPVIWDVACLNGAFDQSSACFAETWLNTPGKGAVAIWASTVLASWDEPAIWSVETTRAFTHDGTFRYGEANMAGMLGLIAIGGTGSNIEEEFEKYVLFGDPLLEMRSREPVELAVDHFPTGNELGGPFPVTVTTGGSPLAHARVAASSKGQVLGVALTDATGVAGLDLPPLSEQTFHLTVTARDAIPVQKDVALQPPECGFLALDAKDLVACNQTVTLTLADVDLDVNPAAADTAVVALTVGGSDAGVVTLTETGPATHTFTGAVHFAKAPQAGEVALAHGQQVLLRYDDAGCKGAPTTVTRELVAQCEPPQVTGVTVDQIGPMSARIGWTTNVPASSTVEYGETLALGKDVKATSLVQSHQVLLSGLTYATTYLLRVGSVDQVGNAAWDDNAGAMYSFATLPCQPACTGKQCGPDGCGGVCGTCADGMQCGAGSVCECPTHTTKGCKGCKCEKCVCAMDDFCCLHEWDAQCAKECVEQCGGCEIVQTDGGVEDAAIDAQPEASTDAETEAAADAGAEAEVEAGKDAGFDAAKDASEAGAEAGMDATADARAEASPSTGEEISGGGCSCASAGTQRSSFGAWVMAALGAVAFSRCRRRGMRG